MVNELEAICLELRNNLKSEESVRASFENVDKLNRTIEELNETKLSNNLHILIPTILEIINNFELKLKGVQLLDQLIKRLDHQCFARQGFDNLIIFTLKNQFYHQEINLFKRLFTICETALVKFNFQSSNSTKVVTELDEIIDIVLIAIEIGTDDKLRLICLEELPKLIKILDKAIYKHLNRLIDSLITIADAHFLAVRQEQIKASLFLLKQIINLTHENFNETKSLIILIKLLYCLNSADSQSIDLKSIRNEIIDCLKLIYNLNPTMFKTYLNELQINDELIKLNNYIQNDLDIIYDS